MDAVWPHRRSVETRILKPMLVAAGAAVAVGIGYIDPGNWATDLDATRYGNTLLWSIVLSGFAAAALQVLVVRYAAASGSGLMEAIAERFPSAQNALWTVYALSIIATELSEFVGLVVGLHIVTALPLSTATALAIAILGAMLVAGGAAARRFEIIAIVTTMIVALIYAFEMGIIRPPLGPILAGATIPSIPGQGALLAVIGIVGATIMPHNLFLQAGLVRDELRAAPERKRRRIATQAVWSTVATLMGATFINLAIAVVGSAMHADTIERAFQTLRPLAGSAAALLFGLALIAAALAASISAACAGAIICTSGAPIRLNRTSRRVIAIAPAVALLAIGVSPTALLLASQVALGVALPAVVVPLIVIVFGERLMKTRADRTLLAVSIGVIVAACGCDGFAFTSLFSHV